MPQVDVNINGRRYQIACDEGQEEHLTQLADYVDKRVQELVGACALGAAIVALKLTLDHARIATGGGTHRGAG